MRYAQLSKRQHRLEINVNHSVEFFHFGVFNCAKSKYGRIIHLFKSFWFTFKIFFFVKTNSYPTNVVNFPNLPTHSSISRRYTSGLVTSPTTLCIFFILIINKRTGEVELKKKIFKQTSLLEDGSQCWIVSSSAFSSRPVRTNFEPSFENIIAVARPIPEEAPKY